MYISSYNISREDLFDSKNPYVSVKIVCCVKFCLKGERGRKGKLILRGPVPESPVAIRATSFYFETKIAT